MLTPQTVIGYAKAEPFRPFRPHWSSGCTFDVRHPDMNKILKSSVFVFKLSGNSTDLPDERESVSLMQTESISHREAATR